MTDISKFIESGGTVKRGKVKRAKGSGIWQSIPQHGIRALKAKPNFQLRHMGVKRDPILEPQ